MSMEKEALTNTIESDLARRNRNWDKVDAHLAENANKAHGGFKGFLGTISSNINLPHDSLEAININKVIYDDGFWKSTDNTKITIPNGVSKVRVKARIEFFTSGTGHRLLLIRKNNAYIDGEAQVSAQAVNDIPTYLYAESAVMNVEQGDYFTVRIRQTSGSTLSVSTQTWIALEVIE